MNYTLGLDIGIASVGWAVLQNGADGVPIKIENLGVRIFTKAEQSKTGASLALPRREARGSRRRIRRRRHRKERIKHLIEEQGIMTRGEMNVLFKKSGFAEDVYTLRADGLNRRLTQDEWVRVLIHLAQRRGYRSNSTAEDVKAAKDKKDKEAGAVKQALSDNEALMQEKHYRTVGEMFCKDEKFTLTMPDGRIIRKTRNAPNSYRFTVTRDMIEAEAKLLFEKQRAFGNEYASAAFEEAYLAILLGQRNFDEGPGGDSPYQNPDLRGYCIFEKEERRAFKACYTFEYFKLLQDINHIRLESNETQPTPLNQQQREKIIALAMKTANLNYQEIRKELQLPDELRFNMVRYEIGKTEEDTKFLEMQSYHKIKKALGTSFDSLTVAQLDGIGEILSLYKSDERRKEQLEQLGLTKEMIKPLLSLSFSKAGNLSLTAMRNLIPHLEQGVNYSDACKAAYGDHRAHIGAQKTKLLSYNRLREEGALEAITNPVVLRAVSQTIKVINAIVRKYGSPQFVNIELAREMNRNREQRKNIEDQNNKNRKVNDAAREQIEKVKQAHATGLDIVKYKLFCEQKEVCMYSGTSLDIDRLFAKPGYVDVDHIIPYSRSFDDSYTNKVLVLSSENRQKENHLPLEYMAGDVQKAEQFRVRVETTIRDYRKRQKLLKESISEEEEKRFRERNLRDTQYITSAVHDILNNYLACAPSKSKRPVNAVNGVVTDYIRKRLGLKKVREDGDLHHAMDAVIIAVTTNAMTQKISGYYKRREWNKKRTSDYVDPETGELLTREAYDSKYPPEFPEPWSKFRKELEARLSEHPYDEIMHLNLATYDAEEEIKPVFVSRMPNRKVTGPAHEETIRSAKMPLKKLERDEKGELEHDEKGEIDGYYKPDSDRLLAVVKTPLTKLRLKNGKIDGYYRYYRPDSDRLLYEALKAQLEKYGGKGDKAFTEPFHKPKRDGTPGPIVRAVKTYKPTSLNVRTNGGIADNGKMIRIDIYYVPDDGYYFVPIYVADTVKESLPNLAVVRRQEEKKKQKQEQKEQQQKAMQEEHFQYSPYPKEWKPMQDEHFQFSLYPGDLVLVRSNTEIELSRPNDKSIKEKEWRLYYRKANIANGSLTLETHDRKYKIDSLGIKGLLSMEKYEVDVLGEYHKVHLPEIRTGFR